MNPVYLKSNKLNKSSIKNSSAIAVSDGTSKQRIKIFGDSNWGIYSICDISSDYLFKIGVHIYD